MAKQLILWKRDYTHWPTEPAEQAAILGKMMEMTKQPLENGDITEWGYMPAAGRDTLWPRVQRPTP